MKSNGPESDRDEWREGSPRRAGNGNRAGVCVCVSLRPIYCQWQAGLQFEFEPANDDQNSLSIQAVHAGRILGHSRGQPGNL